MDCNQLILKRDLAEKIRRFRDKLVIVFGPRQVGKTFVINQALSPDLTFNMDIPEERLLFRKMPQSVINWYETRLGKFPQTGHPERKPVVFVDEIHKVRGWRDILKGTFDKTSHAIQFVASGSSAFQLRQQDKGDSLAGRAVWLAMWPVTFREYLTTVAPEIELPPKWVPGTTLLTDIARTISPLGQKLRTIWDAYSRFGSFPENLIRQDPEFHKQWFTDYTRALLDRDLKDLGTARDVDRVHQVFSLLMEGTGSTYSLRNMAQTTNAAPDTIKKDILAIRQVLWGFDVPVATVAKAKQIRKEKKFYPVDHSFLDFFPPASSGAGLETTVACMLHRTVPDGTLGFFRDYQKREIDFVVRDKKTIFLAVECKSQEGPNHLESFSRTFKPRESILVVNSPGVFEKRDDYFVVSVEFMAVM